MNKQHGYHGHAPFASFLDRDQRFTASSHAAAGTPVAVEEEEADRPARSGL